MEIREKLTDYKISMLRFAILNQRVNFYSPCDFFPKYFEVTGIVTEVKEYNDIALVTLILDCNGKTMHVDGGMKNLTFCIK